MREGKLDCFSALFDEVERSLTAADSEVRDMLVIGLLEDIQNISTWGKIDPDIGLPFLGPESRKGWFELIRMWHGRPGDGWPGQKEDIS